MSFKCCGIRRGSTLLQARYSKLGGKETSGAITGLGSGPMAKPLSGFTAPPILKLLASRYLTDAFACTKRTSQNYSIRLKSERSCEFCLSRDCFLRFFTTWQRPLSRRPRPFLFHPCRCPEERFSRPLSLHRAPGSLPFQHQPLFGIPFSRHP